MSHGHLIADLDPLKLAETYGNNEIMKEKFKVPPSSLRELVDYRTYGFTEADL